MSEQRKNPVKVDLKVNGRPVSLNPYVESVFSGVLVALVSTLKNTPEPERIEIEVSR